jgi:alkanesulfonate monooxygenase SsuD/methylene tetrahydromethanopterin reductase-like flavin-dependent oxidoreductase (luciferase family)
MREKVLAMQAIWTQDEAAFHGRFVDFDPILSWPKPVQKPFPPVLVGGDGHLSLRAAATYGDGWIPGIEEIAAFEEQRAEVYRLCDEAGRPPIGITVCAFDQSLMSRCSELGVDRFVVAVSEAHELTALRSFLDGYAALGTRLGTSPP